MGLASSMGLGVALAQPERKVVVIDGDGSVLMNLGGLTTLARYAPPNLTHLVFDNESLLSVGGFPTATSTGSDLAAIARGADPDAVELGELLAQRHLFNECRDTLGHGASRVAPRLHGGIRRDGNRRQCMAPDTAIPESFVFFNESKQGSESRVSAEQRQEAHAHR